MFICGLFLMVLLIMMGLMLVLDVVLVLISVVYVWYDELILLV